VLGFGDLKAEYYEDSFHKCHPVIDELRSKMFVKEDERYSREYHEPDKRSIANAIEVYFKDGSPPVGESCEYPLGHKRRRDEGFPILERKFMTNLKAHFEPEQANQIYDVCQNQASLEKMPVHEFMNKMVIS